MSKCYKCISVDQDFAFLGFVVGQYYQGAYREVSNCDGTIGLAKPVDGKSVAFHVTGREMATFVEV